MSDHAVPRFHRHRARGCRRRRLRRVRVLRPLRTGAGQLRRITRTGRVLPGGGGGSSGLRAVSNATTSMPSGAPKVITTTEPPRLATRPTSRSAATGFPAYCNELKPVTTSKLSSANGSCSRSPWWKSPAGTRDRAIDSIASAASTRDTSAPRAAAISAAMPEPHPASRYRVPGPTWVRSSNGLENRADRPFLKVGPVPRARTPKATVCFRGFRLQLGAHLRSSGDARTTV